MKILLTHAYAKENKGDAAIVSVLLQQLRDTFPGAKVAIATYDDDARYTTEEHTVLSNSMYLGVYRFRFLPLKVLYSFYIENTVLLWALLYRLFGRSFKQILPKPTRALAQAYMTSDLFVAAGGGYLRAKQGVQEDVNLLLLLNPLIVGSLLKKPIILYTQSIGPLASPLQEWLVRIVLNRTQHIFVREDHTVTTLQRIGVKPTLVTRTIDAGFLFSSEQPFPLSEIIKDKEMLQSHLLVGITVRKWLDQEGQKRFERAIADFIERVTREKPVCILFIPQVTSTLHRDDDRDVAERIVNMAPERHNIINCTGSYDHFQLKQLYSHLDVLVGTRFHSVIFSLTSHVPAVAIEYEYKTGGIMNDLGLSQWVIPIEEVTAENLYEKFLQLENEKEWYARHLHQVLPEYIVKAKEVARQMKEIYCAIQGKKTSHFGC